MEVTVQEAIIALQAYNIQSIAHCNINDLHEYSVNIKTLEKMDPNKKITIYKFEPHGLLTGDVFRYVRKAGKSALYQVSK